MNSLRVALFRLNSLNRGSYVLKLNQRLGLFGNKKEALNLSYGGKRFSSSHSNHSDFSRTGLSYTLIGSALCGVILAVNANDSPKKEKTRPRPAPVQAVVEIVEEQESTEVEESVQVIEGETDQQVPEASPEPVLTEATTESTETSNPVASESESSVTTIETESPAVTETVVIEVIVSEPESVAAVEIEIPVAAESQTVVTEAVVQEPAATVAIVETETSGEFPEAAVSGTETHVTVETVLSESVEIPSQSLPGALLQVEPINSNSSNAELVSEATAVPTSPEGVEQPAQVAS